MKIINFPAQIVPTPEIKPPRKEAFKEYMEQKEVKDAEIKVSLQQIEQKMVDLKALIAQITAIRTEKDVS